MTCRVATRVPVPAGGVLIGGMLMAPGAERRAPPEQKDWGAMWEVFHLLWGRARGQPPLRPDDYDKRLWVELQRRLEAIQHGDG